MTYHKTIQSLPFAWKREGVIDARYLGMLHKGRSTAVSLGVIYSTLLCLFQAGCPSPEK
jgi:hypothetical protein